MVVAAAAAAASPETPPTLSLLPVYLSSSLSFSRCDNLVSAISFALSLPLSRSLSLSLFPLHPLANDSFFPGECKKNVEKKEENKTLLFSQPRPQEKAPSLFSLLYLFSTPSVPPPPPPPPYLLRRGGFSNGDIWALSLEARRFLRPPRAGVGRERSKGAGVGRERSKAPASGERGRKAPATRERSEEGENHQFLSNWPINSQLRAPVCFSLSTAGRRNQRAENKGGTKGFIKRRRGKKRENKRTV